MEELDGGNFQEDAWTRPGGGGGISRVLTNGNVFEKAGCSLSVVYGSMPQEALQSATTRGADRAKGYAPGERVPFFACGLSSVMHPRNPMVRATRAWPWILARSCRRAALCGRRRRCTSITATSRRTAACGGSVAAAT